MTDPVPTATPTRSRPQTQQFRRQANATRLSNDQKRRQAVITDAAWRRFGERDRLIAFLNTPDEALGGRPLDLAVDGDDGLAAVLVRLDTVAGPSNPG